MNETADQFGTLPVCPEGKDCGLVGHQDVITLIVLLVFAIGAVIVYGKMQAPAQEEQAQHDHR